MNEERESKKTKSFSSLCAHRLALAFAFFFFLLLFLSLSSLLSIRTGLANVKGDDFAHVWLLEKWSEWWWRER